MLHVEQETTHLAFLMQPAYPDGSTGQPVDASDVEHLAVYQALADGFYKWQCSGCDKVHTGRGFSAICGLVETCEGCGTKNLLVATDTTAIAEARRLQFANAEREAELNRLRDVESEAQNTIVHAARLVSNKWGQRIYEFIRSEVAKDMATSNEA